MNRKVALLYTKIRSCQREHLGSFSFSNPNLQARWSKERLDRKRERELLKFSRNILFTLRMEVVKEVKEKDVGIAQLQIRNRKKSQLL